MFNNILFATTGSAACDNAARVAFDLAETYGAKLHIFHVFGIPTHGNSPFVIDVRTGLEEEIYDPDYTAWVREEMKNTYINFLPKSSHYEIECATGSPHREILRKARREKVDLIIMGAHTRHVSDDLVKYRNITGNTMQQVAKSAFCPVFIVNRPCNTPLTRIQKIVYGSDFSKASYAAFRFACNMASTLGAELHLIHIVEICFQQFGKPEEQWHIEKKIKEAQRKINSIYLPDLRQLASHHCYVGEGIPHVEVLKYAREKQTDLIVLAHHAGRTNQLGSMIEQVTLRASCPVASVNRQPGKTSHTAVA